MKCARHAAKWAGIAPAEPTLAVEVAIWLRWRLSLRHSALRLDRNLAILTSIRGGWTAYLEMSDETTVAAMGGERAMLRRAIICCLAGYWCAISASANAANFGLALVDLRVESCMIKTLSSWKRSGDFVCNAEKNGINLQGVAHLKIPVPDAGLMMDLEEAPVRGFTAGAWIKLAPPPYPSGTVFSLGAWGDGPCKGFPRLAAGVSDDNQSFVLLRVPKEGACAMTGRFVYPSPPTAWWMFLAVRYSETDHIISIRAVAETDKEPHERRRPGEFEGNFKAPEFDAIKALEEGLLVGIMSRDKELDERFRPFHGDIHSIGLFPRLMTDAELDAYAAATKPPDFPLEQLARIDEVEWAGRTLRDCSVCPELVALPLGTVVMGGNDTGAMPRHVRTIRTPFAIGRYEVTQAEWRAVMGTNPTKSSEKGFESDYNRYAERTKAWGENPSRGDFFRLNKYQNKIGDDYPVTNVSWDDVLEFVKRLNKISGKKYRLPTEAEWEFAARAGYTGATWDEGTGSGELFVRVGRGKPNGFELHEMMGNARELTSSLILENRYLVVNGLVGEYSYIRDVSKDLRDVSPEGQSEMCIIVRGPGPFSRECIRRDDRRGNNIGFRLARDLF